MNPDNGEAQIGAGEVPSLPDGKNPVEQVFRIPMIWKIIGSYLNVGDLKACRLVNSEFHGIVTKEANFLRRCLVSLKPHHITRNQFGSTCEPWKNVLLKFGNSGGEGSSSDARFDPEELEWLYPLLSDVESLSLRMEKGIKGDGFHPLLQRLLNAPKALRALGIEPILLTDEKTASWDVWKDAVENLEEFHILQPPLGWQNGVDGWIPLLPWIASIALGKVKCSKLFPKMSKLRVLESFYHPLLAPEFRRRNVAFTFQENFDLKSEGMMLSVVLENIALTSRNTLKQVTLGGTLTRYASESEAFSNEDDFIQAFSFPSLVSATFYDFGFKPVIVTRFLMALVRIS